MSDDDVSLVSGGNLDQLIESSPSLYVLQKRAAYLVAFVDYLRCKAQKRKFVPPRLNASYLDNALDLIVRFVQKRVYGDAVNLMHELSPDSFEDVVKRCSADASQCQKGRLKELRSLKKYRPCVDDTGKLRIEGRLSKSPAISFDAKHPLVLPSRHPLTRLVILFYHVRNSHSGVQHTLLSSRQRFWIANGNGSVRKYLHDCGVCAIEKARPIRQLMSDLPQSRTTAFTKPFFNCGMDYFGPLTFVEGRSHKKAWGLLFTCMSSRAIHVELVTSLSLSEFLLAFTRFCDLRGPVSTIYSDNGSTFQAASKRLPELLESREFQNSLRKEGIDWELFPLCPSPRWCLGGDVETG